MSIGMPMVVGEEYTHWTWRHPDGKPAERSGETKVKIISVNVISLPENASRILFQFLDGPNKGRLCVCSANTFSNRHTKVKT